MPSDGLSGALATGCAREDVERRARLSEGGKAGPVTMPRDAAQTLASSAVLGQLYSERVGRSRYLKRTPSRVEE